MGASATGAEGILPVNSTAQKRGSPKQCGSPFLLLFSIYPGMEMRNHSWYSRLQFVSGSRPLWGYLQLILMLYVLYGIISGTSITCFYLMILKLFVVSMWLHVQGLMGLFSALGSCDVLWEPPPFPLAPPWTRGRGSPFSRRINVTPAALDMWHQTASWHSHQRSPHEGVFWRL